MVFYTSCYIVYPKMKQEAMFVRELIGLEILKGVILLFELRLKVVKTKNRSFL